MATCRDCFHCNACHEMWLLIAVAQEDDFFERNDAETCEDFVNTADVAEVRHGECVIDRAEHIVPVGRKNSIKHISYKCSECGRKFGNNKYLNYCPNCGAKMDGGGQNDL